VFQETLRSRLEAAGDYVIYQDALTRMTTASPTEHPPYPHAPKRIARRTQVGPHEFPKRPIGASSPTVEAKT
jgi:hypothetical protein